MSANDTKFSGSIPELYEQYLGNLLFEPYAADIARRVGGVTQGTLVEVAAGTGVVTRALRRALPASVRLVATDLNEAMLSVAATRVRDASVSFQQADAQRLPFADGSAAALVCQFGMMFVPDKVQAYREARRVLADGAAFVFNVWDQLSKNEVSLLVMRALAELYPKGPPSFFERAPFGYFDGARIAAELRSAGFEQLQIETVEKVTHAPSAEHVAIGMCQGTPLRGEIEAIDPGGLERATRAVTSALAAQVGSGPFENRMSALVVTATRS